MKIVKKYIVMPIGISLLGIGLLVKGSTLTAPATGTWLPAGTMPGARSGAAAVFLPDGRVLVTGGTDATGAPIASAEFFNSDGSFTAAPVMNFARTAHTATVLQDGRVLVAGGTDATGKATQSAELFAPSSNSWTVAGPLMVARSVQTATLLSNGQVLIAGGSANAAALASLELFDPASNSFSVASASLSTPRENHAAALLQDGRVLIVGGWDGTTTVPQPPATTGNPNVLASSDIYDPAAGTVSAGPALTTARMNHTATTQLDGKVAVIAGSDGTSDLASIEVFDPATGTFALASSLTTARSGHLAFLLPHNANVLVVGGASGGSALASAELYTPWTDSTSGTGAMASPRSGAAGSPLYGTVAAMSSSPTGVGLDGMLMVAGGSSAVTSTQPPAPDPQNALATSEVFGFATVKTDAADYAPGTTVNITGSGWQPGETVQLAFPERPPVDYDGTLSAVADAN